MRRSLLPVLTLVLSCTAVADLPSLGEAEVVSTGHAGLEGPVSLTGGDVLFSDVSAAKILRFHADTGETSVLDPESGGANGLFLLGSDLVRCEGASRRVTLSRGLDGVPEPIAEDADGNRFNAPNDLFAPVDAGGLFFTDPWYGPAEKRANKVEGVYVLTIPMRPDTRPVLALDHLTRPNGVTASPDGRTLYVADEGERKIFTFEVEPGGGGTPPTLSNERLFADVTAYGNPDGMCVDAAGRVYAALFQTGKLLVLSPEGEPLSLSDAGERTSNVCLDHAEENAYVTAGSDLLRFALDTGRPADEAPLP